MCPQISYTRSEQLPRPPKAKVRGWNPLGRAIKSIDLPKIPLTGVPVVSRRGSPFGRKDCIGSVVYIGAFERFPHPRTFGAGCAVVESWNEPGLLVGHKNPVWQHRLGK